MQKYNGISFGFASTMADERNVTTNGLRIGVPGIGIVSFMGNGFPNARGSFDLNTLDSSSKCNFPKGIYIFSEGRKGINPFLSF